MWTDPEVWWFWGDRLHNTNWAPDSNPASSVVALQACLPSIKALYKWNRFCHGAVNSISYSTSNYAKYLKVLYICLCQLLFWKLSLAVIQGWIYEDVENGEVNLARLIKNAYAFTWRHHARFPLHSLRLLVSISPARRCGTTKHQLQTFFSFNLQILIDSFISSPLHLTFCFTVALIGFPASLLDPF